jgi:anti-anti-sigma factor
MDGGVAVVTFGTLKQIKEELCIGSIGDRLMDLVNQEGVRKVLVDFDGITQMASQFLGKLIQLHKRLVLQLKGRLVIPGLNEQIMEVFQITRLDVFFTIATDRDAALTMF